MVQSSNQNLDDIPVGVQTEGTISCGANKPLRIDESTKWSDGPMCFTPSEREARTFRLECLKMATLHANAELVETGAVYKIAEDYYDYIINGKKQNNVNS